MPKQPFVESLATKAESLECFTGFKVNEFKRAVALGVQEIGKQGIFEEYTRHDITHMDAMLRICDWLIPDETRATMTPADGLLIYTSLMLHDFGMLVTKKEFQDRDSASFDEFKRSTLEASDSEGASYRALVRDLNATETEKFLYQEFVRAHHAARIRNWLKPTPDFTYGGDGAVCEILTDVLSGVDPVFVQDLGLVCESHHRDDIFDIRRYRCARPYGDSTDETANVQYAAIILRAADLLHVTRDRTPSITFRLIDPANPVSQLEWAKQMAVRSVRPQPGRDRDGNVSATARQDTIEVHALFASADAFFGLTSYLSYVEKELSLCNAWATQSATLNGLPHKFPWRRIDSSNVEAEGFIAESFEFRLDQQKILDLLTGHTLYNDPGVVVRELSQNAIDAARLNRLVRAGDSKPYFPRVSVCWDPDGRELIVTDNGTGMTQAIIEQNFLKVGSSRYQEEKFIKAYPSFSAISRFGIGVLSTFMVSDDVEVVTCHPDEDEARRIALRSVHGRYLIRLLSKDNEDIPELIRASGSGTSVKVKLRPGAELDDVARLLQQWIVVPTVDVEFVLKGERSGVKIGHVSAEDALEHFLLESGQAFQGEGGALFTAYGAEIRVAKATVGDAVEIAYVLRWNKYFQNWSFFELAELPSLRKASGSNRSEIGVRSGTCIEGILVESTTPGFPEGNQLVIANVTGRSAPRTNVARTALERTPEWEDMIAAVFGAYVGHVNAELAEMTSSRGLSSTAAAREGKYIVQGMLGERSDAPSRLRDAFDQLRILVTDIGGKRSLTSTADLLKHESFVMFQSARMRSVEHFLEVLPGSAGLESALGLGGLSLPDFVKDGEVILSMDESIFPHVFSRSQPVEFEITKDNELLVRWSRLATPSSSYWTRPLKELKDIAIGVHSGLVNAASDINVYVPLQGISVTADEHPDLISFQGVRFVNPNSPVMSLPLGVIEGLPDAYARAMLVMMLMVLDRVEKHADKGELQRSRSEYFRGTALGEAMAVAGDAWYAQKLQMFDAYAWDRRQSGKQRLG